MVKIKNISSARVTISLPSIRLHREIPAGMIMPFKDDEYEYLTFDPGFNAIIDGHYIKILDAPAIEGVSTVIAQTNTYEAPDIKEMLQKRDITKFAKFIPNATIAEREAVKKYAVELRVTDSTFATLIQKYCGINIIDAISNYADAVSPEG